MRKDIRYRSRPFPSKWCSWVVNTDYRVNLEDTFEDVEKHNQTEGGTIIFSPSLVLLIPLLIVLLEYLYNYLYLIPARHGQPGAYCHIYSIALLRHSHLP
jgi:hypothetical protein